MFICLSNRFAVSQVIFQAFLKKEVYSIEIGVHQGAMSRFILEHLAPKKHFAVDPWDARVICDSYRKADDREEWIEPLEKRANYYGGLIEQQTSLEENFKKTEKVLSAHLNAEIMRKSSQDAFKYFNEIGLTFNYFYIDGAHDFRTVLADIHSFSCLGVRGMHVIQLNDCCNSRELIAQNAGVVEAVTKFLQIKPQYRPILVSATNFSDVVLVEKNSDIESQIVDIIRRVENLNFIEVPDNLLPQIRFEAGRGGGFLSFS